MPKEKVYNLYYGQFARQHCTLDHDHGGVGQPCEESQQPLDDSFLHVGWNKDLGQVELAVMKESDDEVDNDRWHSQFDRYGINRLIRVLKQARNDAWGKDE